MAVGVVILNAKLLGVTDDGKILLKTVHVWIGYVFALNLTWRLVWAFIGGTHARWRAILPGGRGSLTPRHLRRTVEVGLLECAEHALHRGVMLAVPDRPLLKSGIDHFEPCAEYFREWISEVRHPALTLLARTDARSPASRDRLVASHNAVSPRWILAREPTGHKGTNSENKETEIEYYLRGPSDS